MKELNNELIEERSNRLTNKLFFECSSQEIVNIIEALSVYKELMLPEKYRYMIDKQLDKLIQQLKLQQIDIFSDNSNVNNIGKVIVIDDISGLRQAIILGASKEEHLIKVAVIENNSFKIIEIPNNLIVNE